METEINPPHTHTSITHLENSEERLTSRIDQVKDGISRLKVEELDNTSKE